jgi:hypothetical protein
MCDKINYNLVTIQEQWEYTGLSSFSGQGGFPGDSHCLSEEL